MRLVQSYTPLQSRSLVAQRTRYPEGIGFDPHLDSWLFSRQFSSCILKSFKQPKITMIYDAVQCSWSRQYYAIITQFECDSYTVKCLYWGHPCIKDNYICPEGVRNRGVFTVNAYPKSEVIIRTPATPSKIPYCK